jgi:hypothetical protein
MEWALVIDEVDLAMPATIVCGWKSSYRFVDVPTLIKDFIDAVRLRRNT